MKSLVFTNSLASKIVAVSKDKNSIVRGRSLKLRAVLLTGLMIMGFVSGQAQDSFVYSHVGAYLNSPSLTQGTNAVNLHSGHVLQYGGNPFLYQVSNATMNSLSLGTNSLNLATTGNSNLAIGINCGMNNTTGYANTFLGIQAGKANTSGEQNVFIGNGAGAANTSGRMNVFIGQATAMYNTTGQYNTVVGQAAATNATTAGANTILGFNACQSNIAGGNNTVIGYRAARNMFNGGSNVYIGQNSGYDDGVIGSGSIQNTGSENCFLGNRSGSNNSTGSKNTYLGYNATGVADNANQTAIGWGATVTGANKVRIGNTAITEIGGQVGWSTLSDGRLKSDVKDFKLGLEFINKLRPVSYVYNNSDNGIRYDGFIAQEVETILKEMRTSFSGVYVPKSEEDFYSIRYGDFAMPIVNAIQELSKENEFLKSQIEILNQRVTILEGNTKIISNPITDKTLFQNNPNPFGEVTIIRYRVPEKCGNSSIVIYDLTGKQLKNIPLVNGGEASVQVQANELNAGTYLYSLICGQQVVDTKHLTIIGK